MTVAPVRVTGLDEALDEVSIGREPRGPASPPAEPVDLDRLLEALRAAQRGEFDVRLPVAGGVAGEIAAAFNDIVGKNQRTVRELRRIQRTVGRSGRIHERATLGHVDGDWARLIDAVNELIEDVTTPSIEVTRVLDAVARGDLNQRLALEVDGRTLRGEFRRSREVVNTMVDQLRSFASEVTRVAREVGTEGKLGGQAEVPGVGGTWKDLTDSVNSMAGNLTAQVRNIADVTTAVARGDLSRKITVDVRGEILELKNTINTMVDQLNAFASEVTRVAREVGTEGKLGGQADVRGVGGTWKDLTENVNRLAANLTGQVRAIGEVATAVTRDDLSRTIEVEAAGEVGVLKDDINEMIRRLRDTTRENREQDWLKTNAARFSRLLQGQRNPATVGRLVLSELAPLIGAQHGVLYLVERDEDSERYVAIASYAAPERIDQAALADGLVGQCARDQQRICLSNVPSGYIAISSGLGSGSPQSIVLQPVIVEGSSRAVLELASVSALDPVHLALLDHLADTLGIALSSIDASVKAEELMRAQAARAEAEAGLARLGQVVDVMPEGILISDAAGNIYLRNAAAEQILGSVPASVLDEVGWSVRHLDGTPCEAAKTPLARAVYGAEVVLGEQLIVTNEVTGREVPILVNSAPLSDGSGAPSGGVAVFQDITPMRDLERQKDEFLAAVSHDLKTPATIIMGRASLLHRALAREHLDPAGAVVEGLTSIDESTSQLVRLVDELLDITRWRMGQPIELDLGPADLIKLTDRLAGEYRNMSPRHTIVVNHAVPRLVGDWDQARIERVLANLLSNAVKYSPKGGEIEITTSQVERDGETWAAFSVRDTGIGIPPAEIDRVFEPYFRGSNVTKTISGTGVGLAGTRHIVEQHGGEIGVESELDGGTIFTVLLPLLRDRAHADA